MKHSPEENAKRKERYKEKYQLAREEGFTGQEAAKLRCLSWGAFHEKLLLKMKKEKKKQVLGDQSDDFSFIQALGLEEIT